MKKSSTDLQWRLEKKGIVDSTNLVAETFKTGNVVVVADEQTAGKGRFDRVWDSPKGNLYCSLIFTPPLGDNLNRYGFLTATALRETLLKFNPRLYIHCKWPNDVFIGGRKVSGILSKVVGTFDKPRLIIGLGVNIVSFPEKTRTMYQATSLNAEGVKITKEELLSQFLSCFNEWSDKPAKTVFDYFSEHLYGKGKQIVVDLGHEKISGVLNGLDCDGALLLNKGTTVLRIVAGDVFYKNEEDENDARND